MKIVINAYSARLGGGQTYVRNLLQRVPDDPALEILVFAPPGLALPEHPAIVRGTTRWPVENPLLRLFWERFRLPRILAESEADILFSPGGLLNTIVPDGCRTVTMFRNMLPFDKAMRDRLKWGPQKVRNLLLRRSLLSSMQRADLVIFISEFGRNQIERLGRLKKTVTISHGIARPFLTASTRLPRPDVAGDGPYILYVSRFEPYKHHIEVVQGYAMLPKPLRDQYRLVLAGEDNYEAAADVRALIERSGLTDRVVLAGGVPYDQLPALYNNAEVNVFASSCENCPNILLESMGAGRPVLSSDVMPMPEIGGLDLAYFSPYDPADFCRQLELVLSDERLADRVVQAARDRAALYDWDVTANRTWAALRDLANEGVARD
ncbi:glycosyltransferase family 4 protein [Tsuneonella sp. HG094]